MELQGVNGSDFLQASARGHGHMHKLTDEERCLLDPEYVPGNGPGHIMPGLGFMAFCLPLYWVLLSRYYKSVAKGSTYRFDGRIMNMTLPFLPQCLTFEKIILFVMGPTFAIINTFYTLAIKGEGIDILVSQLVDVHAFSYYSFIPYCVATMLKGKKSYQIPENCPQALLCFAFAAFACSFYGHLLTVCEYEVTMHQFFLFTPIVLGAVCAAGQLRHPHSFLVAVAVVFWAFAIGAGFLAIGFLSFYYGRLSPDWARLPTHDKTKHMPPFFAVHCVLLVGIFLALFLAFGWARGRRLGRDNPEYRLRPETASDGCGYAPVKTYSDEQTDYWSPGRVP